VRGKIDHHYLRALAAACSDSTLGIVEVEHAKPHEYYLSLLGLQEAKKEKAQLALDDGSGDFPEARPRTAKRPREPAALEDEDFHPAALEDVEDDEEGNIFDVAFNEALDAELADANIQHEADALDTFEDMLEEALEQLEPDGELDGDQGRERAARDPSSLNHRLGPFGYTLKLSEGRFSWQCTCPFHRKTNKTGCRKTMNLKVGVSSFDAESDRVLCILQHWANQAHKYSRQRHHVAWTPDESSLPPMEVLAAQSNIHGPAERLATDGELDMEHGIEVATDIDNGSDDGGDSCNEFVASDCRSMYV